VLHRNYMVHVRYIVMIYSALTIEWVIRNFPGKLQTYCGALLYTMSFRHHKSSTHVQKKKEKSHMRTVKKQFRMSRAILNETSFAGKNIFLCDKILF